MARDLNPKCKQCRRAKEKLFLKGDRCHSPKCAMIKKSYAPGMHGQKMARALSEYGKQLAMKQRIKRIYGVMERQFRKHFAEIQNKQGVTGDLLMIRLEMRLDNVVYRMGLADSRSTARQLVNHGWIVVNDKKLSIPSAKVNVGDVIKVKDGKKEKTYLKNRIKVMKNKGDAPSWLSVNTKTMETKILAEPDTKSIGVNVDPQMVVEFYSR